MATEFLPWNKERAVNKFINSGFSWEGQGTRTLTQSNGRTSLLCPLADSGAFGGFYKSKSAPYTLTACLEVTSPAEIAYGLTFRESGSGKLILFGYSWVGGLRIFKQNSYSSYNSDYSSSLLNNNFRFIRTGKVWFQIQDDNTNRICRLSFDGYNFSQVHSVGRTDFLTADQIGFHCINDGNADATINILSWKDN